VTVAAAAPAEASDTSGPSHAVTIPSLLQLGRRAIPQAIEGAIVPAAIFVSMQQLVGLAAAIVAALGWSAVAILRRLFAGRRVPGMMILGAVTMVARSILGLTTGSAFLYFFQPTIGASCVALAFLVSTRLDQPLAQRFATDFCVLPGHVLADMRVRQFFRRCSVMWCAIGLANASVSLWLLMTQPTAVYVVAKTALSISVTVGAVAASFVWFRRSMTRSGLVVTVA
jgi:intracellular septation protein A